MKGKYAAVVAGGGPAGAAAAITLARRGLQVLLVDDSVETFKIGEALPPAARPLLRDLGVWERFLAAGHLPSSGNLSAWGTEDLLATDFVRNPHGNGWHLDRGLFDTMLRDAAREAGVEVRPGVRLTGVKQRDSGWSVMLRTGKASGRFEEVSAEWLIDATGRRAAVARQLGAVRTQDDRLVAFFSRFRCSERSPEDRDSRTLIEAAPDGWWYTALIPSGKRVVAFLTDSDLSDRAALLSASGFMTSLEATRHVGRLLTAHGCQPDGDPRGTDAGSARLDHFGGEGWIAVGDGALSFDPLSSQGILNALYTGVMAGQAIARAASGEPDLIVQYGRRLEDLYRAYLTNRSTYYAAEARWHDRPFWRRRSVLNLSDGN